MDTIHNPVTTVQLLRGPVEVRELAWPDALTLYHRLLKQSKGFLDDKGQLVATPDRIVSALTENVELGQWLVCKATGKDTEWLAGLTLSEVLDLAAEAATLNVGIVAERLKKAKGRMQALFGGAGQAAGSGAPTSNSQT
jgi:hypothetical protein